MDPAYIKLVFVAAVPLLFLVYWIFNFIILYHLARFGVGVQPKKLAAAFLLGSVVLFSVSVLFLGNIDINKFEGRLDKYLNSSFNVTRPQ